MYACLAADVSSLNNTSDEAQTIHCHVKSPVVGLTKLLIFEQLALMCQ